MSTNLYVGMDVHKETIVLASFEASGTEPIGTIRIANEERRVQLLFNRWRRRGYEIRACYEASEAGYVIQRLLTSWGHGCEVVDRR